jgi:hypothetical protein
MTQAEQMMANATQAYALRNDGSVSAAMADMGVESLKSLKSCLGTVAGGAGSAADFLTSLIWSSD